jgi:phosphatidylethanolamine/phosphatidyl-N-methylethanolamine N-methyltransferase
MPSLEKNVNSLDMLSFLGAWISDPGRVGAVAPSGGGLAALIARELTASSGSVIELGPGTGVFTRAVLARGVKEENMTLIEYLPEFVELLQLRFPKARVLCMDAARLRERRLFESASVGAVVSGLPLLSMSSKRVFYILKGAFSYMEPMGAFYQFTYGPRCPVPRSFLDRLGLKSTRLGRVLLNMPPATVYRITRRRPARLALA